MSYPGRDNIWMVGAEMLTEIDGWSRRLGVSRALAYCVCEDGSGSLVPWYCKRAARPLGWTQWPVTEIIDGDTLAIHIPSGLPAPLARWSVRVRGVDTPERGYRAQCEEERALAEQATDHAWESISEAITVLFREPKPGKYYGRIVADVYLDSESLAESLIQAGLGRPYDGGKRKSWCPKE